MTGRLREISHVFCVEENIEKAELTVQLGAVCAERVAKRIASRQNAQQERRRTTSKSKMTNPVRKNSLLGAKVIQQMKLIEVHEENFEKVATATTTSATSKQAQTAQEIIEVTSTLTLQCLPALHHHDECHSLSNQSSRHSLRD